MFQSIMKGLAAAAPALVVAFVGAVGVNAGREVGTMLGKWTVDRIKGEKPKEA